MFRRRQFGDLIDHQLRVFAADHGDRLAAIRQARSAYRTSDRDEAEKRYGNYADELDWAAEQFSGGAYAATFGVGGLTRFGPDIRTPIGRVHWACTDIAGFGNMHMEGAIRSGRDAAAAILT